MLDKYKETFARITEIEALFVNGCLVTPDSISHIMLELAGHFTYLNAQKTNYEVDKFKRSISIRDLIQNEANTCGIKVPKTRIEQEVDSKLVELVSDIMILEGTLNNVDKLISVCQSSLKSIEREKRMPF